jgi:hypothetical protein
MREVRVQAMLSPFSAERILSSDVAFMNLRIKIAETGIVLLVYVYGV